MRHIGVGVDCDSGECDPVLEENFVPIVLLGERLLLCGDRVVHEVVRQREHQVVALAAH